MTTKLNPLTIAQTIEANGDEPLGERADAALTEMLVALAGIPAQSRVVVFQVLTNFFCPHCGIEQPPGDCQCRKVGE